MTFNSDCEEVEADDEMIQRMILTRGDEENSIPMGHRAANAYFMSSRLNTKTSKTCVTTTDILDVPDAAIMNDLWSSCTSEGAKNVEISKLWREKHEAVGISTCRM